MQRRKFKAFRAQIYPILTGTPEKEGCYTLLTTFSLFSISVHKYIKYHLQLTLLWLFDWQRLLGSRLRKLFRFALFLQCFLLPLLLLTLLELLEGLALFLLRLLLALLLGVGLLYESLLVLGCVNLLLLE